MVPILWPKACDYVRVGPLIHIRYYPFWPVGLMVLFSRNAGRSMITPYILHPKMPYVRKEDLSS